MTRTAAVAARRRAATAGVRYYSDDKSNTAGTSEAKAEGKEGEGDAASTSSATSECEEKLKKKEAEVVDLTVRCSLSDQWCGADDSPCFPSRRAGYGIFRLTT